MATIDLTPFCDPDCKRYAITRPARVGEFVQATDGRVAIKIDAALAPEWKEPDGRFPRFDDVLGPIDSVTNWQPCPTVANCSECDDLGMNRVDCRYCHGSGDHRCDCGDEHACGRCEGDGILFDGLCEACKFFFCNRRLQHKYMIAIAKLPNCELGAVGKKPGDIVFFRFTGGVGAIMPWDSEECA